MDLVVPWRDTGDPFRRAHYWRLVAWYTGFGFRVVPGDRPGEFNRSAARNSGVMAATSDVVCVLDADNLIHPTALHAAGNLAERIGPALVKPFTRFGYMDAAATDAWYAGALDPFAGDTPTWEGDGPATGFNGGAYVMRRSTWFEVGGMDEDFTGWGAEDDAFTITAERRLGKARTIPGTCYHLWHPAQRWTSPENYARLMEEYVNGH